MSDINKGRRVLNTDFNDISSRSYEMNIIDPDIVVW